MSWPAELYACPDSDPDWIIAMLIGVPPLIDTIACKELLMSGDTALVIENAGNAAGAAGAGVVVTGAVVTGVVVSGAVVVVVGVVGNVPG